MSLAQLILFAIFPQNTVRGSFCSMNIFSDTLVTYSQTVCIYWSYYTNYFKVESVCTAEHYAASRYKAQTVTSSCSIQVSWCLVKNLNPGLEYSSVLMLLKYLLRLLALMAFVQEPGHCLLAALKSCLASIVCTSFPLS